MGNLLQEVCRDALRLIHIDRPLDASIRSLQARSRNSHGWLNVSDAAAARVQEWLWREKEKLLASTAHLTVRYDTLLIEPAAEIERLAAHLNLSPTPARHQAAVAHVNPALCRHGA
jgi:hypothetical protein